MDFKIADMISCFLFFERNDLIEELEFIISELKQIYTESESSADEEELEIEVDEQGFYSLK